MLKFSLFPLLLLPLFSQAETFSLQVEDLTFEKERVPDSFDAGGYYSTHWQVGHSDRPLPRHLDAEDAFFTPS